MCAIIGAMRCPICTNDMVKASVGNGTPSYDYCRTCKKELSEMVIPFKPLPGFLRYRDFSGGLTEYPYYLSEDPYYFEVKPCADGQHTFTGDGSICICKTRKASGGLL